MVGTANPELIHRTSKTLISLNSLEAPLLQELISAFLSNLIPVNNRVQAFSDIEEVLRRDLLKKQAEGKVDESSSRIEAYKVYTNLSIIVEFLDKGMCGFLTGDITPKLISWMSKLVDEMVSQMDIKIANFQLNSQSRNTILSEFYNKLFKVCAESKFKLPVNGIPFPDSENPRNLFERQLILEDESSDIAIEKFLESYESLQDMGMTHKLNFARTYMIRWFPELCRVIKMEQEKCMQPNLSGDRQSYGPYILKLSPEKLALIALCELMKCVLKSALIREEGFSESVSTYFIISKILFESIGKTVNMQLQYDQEERMIHKRIQEQMKEAQSHNYNGKVMFVKRAEMMKKYATDKILKKRQSAKENEESMSKTIQYQVGALLTFFIKETAKIKNLNGEVDNLISLSYNNLKEKSKGVNKVVGVCKINEDFMLSVVRDIEKQDSLYIQLERSLPMIYKPAPWVDAEIGGYYQKPTNVMRVENSYLQERAVKVADMSKVYSVLDMIGKIPWRINKKVLSVVESIWSEGGGVGEIPNRYFDYKNYVYEYQVKECTDKKEKSRLLQIVQDQRDVHSLRCDFNLKLDQARAFSNIAKFYYPHNVDFRGRTYPIPPHLNHMSSDLCRGLLEFGEGKPLTESGVKWLFIHLANLMGKDKLPMAEREAYGRSIMPLVEKIGKDPLANREWLEQEDCWQALAVIFEVYAAMNSPNPAEYVSYLHVHQDGSCNGLQHYAALGRDYDGAFQVNLVDRAVPGDLYTHVAKMVEERISADAANPECENYELAQKLKGNVKRKIIKQTVMTTVYGVTFIGARAQIHKQLKDKDFIDQDSDTEGYSASVYLARLTLLCVEDLFTQAHQIKQWLKDCSKAVVSTGNPVSWLTPLG
jgi:DNA-directed RNA polymerase